MAGKATAEVIDDLSTAWLKLNRLSVNGDIDCNTLISRKQRFMLLRYNAIATTLSALNANLASATVTGTDTTGTVAITLGGTGIAAGTHVVTFNFAVAYANATFKVLVSPDTLAHPGVIVQPYSKVQAGFQLMAGFALVAATSYSFDYLVIP